jgi:hypothetical protein
MPPVNKVLQAKIIEAFSSVLPITIIVLLTSVVLVPMPAGMVLEFLGGAALLVIGMGFFTLGADMAMMPMGEGIGIQLTKTKSLVVVLILSFIMGVVITIAEPDLQVLARQVFPDQSFFLIATVGIGVGIFLLLAVLRTLFKIPLYILLVASYAVTFTLSFWTPPAFVPVAFDSGGVTTGPITVPFILAMGAGVAALRSDREGQSDSFGLVALCSVGPILAVMLLGIFFTPENNNAGLSTAPVIETSRDVVLSFAEEIPAYTKEVLQALAALALFFVIFQAVSHRYKRHQLTRILIGFAYTFIGLVVFLTGVNVGFIPIGRILGEQLASSEIKWVLIPLSMLIGYYIVNAEPAVHVLNKQVEGISSGAISAGVMRRGLSIGMAAALGLTMVRILLHIPIMYILIPGYAFALLLTFFVPRIFTGIAFDSGGVCSGPMTSTFLLPLAMGVCEGVGGDMLTEAFGIVSMVAMAPLIVIQAMGLIYRAKLASAQAVTPKAVTSKAVTPSGAAVLALASTIIDYPAEEWYE